MIVVVILRPALLDLLGQLRRIRFRGVEAVFGEELARVRQLAELRDGPGVPLDEGLSAEDSTKLLRLAEISPRAAVLESWGILESDIREALGTEATNTPVVALGDALQQRGLVDPDSLQMFHMLRGLRNQAVHETDIGITTDQAIEYANLARDLSAKIAP